MILFLISGVVLAGAALTLVLRAFVLSRTRAVATLGQIGTYGYVLKGSEEQAPRNLMGTLNDLSGRLGALFAGRFGRAREQSVRMKLMAAGLYRTHPRDFIGYQMLSGVLLPFAVLWMTGPFGLPGIFRLLAFVLAVPGGWSLPMLLVNRRARSRLDKIEYELPELIDLLVVTVEAGLGFSRSLQVASERIQGPLGDELRLSLQEQSMGLSTIEALRNMLERCETPAMRSFVRSVVQGEALGVSIGEIMRSLAVEMRKRRRAGAEERAQKAPVKLLFPLIFLIFPAMFIVILAPAAFQLAKALF